MLKNIFEQAFVQYMVVGAAALATIAIVAILSPLMLMLAFAVSFFLIMSLAVGYVIVDSYKMWREDNAKKQSRKKTSSSQDAW